MVVYRRTYHSATILREGFRDAAAQHMTTRKWSGVWVANVPLDLRGAADGDVLLALEIPEEVFAKYERVPEGKPYREALIPAHELNTFGPPWMKRTRRTARGSTRGDSGPDRRGPVRVRGSARGGKAMTTEQRLERLERQARGRQADPLNRPERPVELKRCPGNTEEGEPV